MFIKSVEKCGFRSYYGFYDFVHLEKTKALAGFEPTPTGYDESPSGVVDHYAMRAPGNANQF